MRRQDLLFVGIAIIAIEILALIALKAGVDYRGAIAGTVLATVTAIGWRVFLQWRMSLLHRTRLLASRITHQLDWPRFSLRTWPRLQFSLRTLLLLFLAIASVCSWHASRRLTIQKERTRLDGCWALVHEDGSPVSVGGTAVVIELGGANGDYSVDPFQEPKSMDFVSPAGSRLRAIYRWEGETLRVVSDSASAERRLSFSNAGRIGIEPGPRVAWRGQNEWTAVRLLHDVHVENERATKQNVRQQIEAAVQSAFPGCVAEFTGKRGHRSQRVRLLGVRVRDRFSKYRSNIVWVDPSYDGEINEAWVGWAVSESSK